MDVYCGSGRGQQAEQSNHLAEGQNPHVTLSKKTKKPSADGQPLGAQLVSTGWLMKGQEDQGLLEVCLDVLRTRYKDLWAQPYHGRLQVPEANEHITPGEVLNDYKQVGMGNMWLSYVPMLTSL
eukprot:1159615-Pelagomonas_calceolata.AAC.5